MVPLASLQQPLSTQLEQGSPEELCDALDE